MKANIEELAKENAKLESENEDLQTQMKSLQAMLDGKPMPVKRRLKLTFSFKESHITCLPHNSPSKNPKSNPAVSKKEQNKEIKKEVKKVEQTQIVQKQELIEGKEVKYYKDRILSPSGLLYEDEALKIAMIRIVDSPNKTATLKLNFFNKTQDKGLSIQQFLATQYNKAGSSV